MNIPYINNLNNNIFIIKVTLLANSILYILLDLKLLSLDLIIIPLNLLLKTYL